jgi:hypothetical protein
LEQLQQVIKRHCRSAQLSSQRLDESGFGEVAYRLVMRSPERSQRMVDELKSVGGVSDIAFALHEEQDEF